MRITPSIRYPYQPREAVTMLTLMLTTLVVIFPEMGFIQLLKGLI
jgi:hypothetical protein